MLAVGGVTRDRCLDLDGALGEVSPRNRRIDALHLATLDRTGQSAVRYVGLGDDEEPGGVSVQPVHDAGPPGNRLPPPPPPPPPSPTRSSPPPPSLYTTHMRPHPSSR